MTFSTAIQVSTMLALEWHFPKELCEAANATPYVIAMLPHTTKYRVFVFQNMMLSHEVCHYHSLVHV
jgi:HD-like signal output (HDOD) protein